MRKMIETAALGLSLCLGGLGNVTYAHAQDPEEGAVDLGESSRPAAEPERNGPAWETPPGAEGSEAPRASDSDDAPKVKEPGPGKIRLYGGGRIGVGGGFKPKGFKPGIYSAGPSPGFQVGADYLLIKYFSLGLEGRFSWINQESSKAKYLLFDFVLKPRAIYRIKVRPIEIYLGVPGGLTAIVPGQSWEKGHTSATVGVLGGATYFFNDSWALSAEMGFNWTFMRFKTIVQVPAPPGTGLPPTTSSAEANVQFGQLTLLALNLVYAF